MHLDHELQRNAFEKYFSEFYEHTLQTDKYKVYARNYKNCISDIWSV